MWLILALNSNQGLAGDSPRSNVTLHSKPNRVDETLVKLYTTSTLLYISLYYMHAHTTANPIVQINNELWSLK